MTFTSTETVQRESTEAATTAPTRESLGLPYGATDDQVWVAAMAATVGDDLRRISGLYSNF